MALFSANQFYKIIYTYNYASQCGSPFSVTVFSVLSKLSDVQNVSCLGLCGRNIDPKRYAQYGLGTFSPQLSVSI